MDLRFLFRRPGMTVTKVAELAGVDHSVASRWKTGRQAKWQHITKLYAERVLTDADLRAAGLNPPPVPTAEAAPVDPAPTDDSGPVAKSDPPADHSAANPVD